MGTPSGSKNQTLFQDRMFNQDVRDFDGGAYQGPGTEGADMHYVAGKEREKQMEKALKHQELNDFRLAASSHRIERTLTKMERVAQSAVAAGPALTPQAKKRIPSFVKLKSKEDTAEISKEDEPPSKRPRADGADDSKSSASAPAATVSTAPSSSSALLGSYESSDDEEEEDNETA
mmetsp:Transcript_103510/g.183885  ORF Transcript_103510/g.183885 Transcript_103510/m.183885 type:complete len:176 (+) Transcript_103510:76-603(+)